MLKSRFEVLFFIIIAALVFITLIIPRIGGVQKNEVVVYVSHDQDYSQPILEAFEKETGIKVKAVYDTEASKTVGLTNRLISEKNNPQADVFWNNEVIRTIQLKKEDILEKYRPVNYAKINNAYKDPDGYWTGFAARARVLVVNIDLVAESIRPQSLEDLTNPEFVNQITIADPRFGTTGPHMSALYALWGKNKFKDYVIKLKKTGLDIAQSNGQTTEKVAEGQKFVGFTDTDDANTALLKKKPILMIYPDQKEDSIGTLVIPNTAMLIKGAKHDENGKKLIDYLVSKKTESSLAFAKSAQMPLLPGVDRPDNVVGVETIKPLAISWEEIYNNLDPTLNFFEAGIIE